ncbi:hypothetical protein EES42_44025 [Streptomyces sp. ADI95-17]|nr:hypothetical protein EES42_44025 [Streptomyces sp. ADI95-17]
MTLPALPATESTFATAPALPAPAAAPPAPPVNTVVRTLNVTAPAARPGFLPHSSQATRALPVSFIAVRESRSQEGSLSSGRAQKRVPAPGMEEMTRPVASWARPFQACPMASQPPNPTRVPRPLMVPQIPSTISPSQTNDLTQWPTSYQWCFSSTGSPQGSLAFLRSSALNPYWSLRSEPSPATICVPPNSAVILLWQVRSAAQNAATVAVMSSRSLLCSSTLSPSYSQSSSSLLSFTNVVASVLSCVSFVTSGRISLA